jgi:uncharacterized protein with PQ loop repeat
MYDFQRTDFHEIHKYSNGISLSFPMLIFNQIGQEVWLFASKIIHVLLQITTVTKPICMKFKFSLRVCKEVIT